MDSGQDNPLCALLRRNTPFSGLNLRLGLLNAGQREDGVCLVYVRNDPSKADRISVSCTPTPQSKLWIQRALETHDDLQYLELQVMDEITTLRFFSDILRPVGLLSRLCEFSFIGSYRALSNQCHAEIILAMSSILVETSSLLILKLMRVKFTTESMEQFVRGLRSNQTLAKLDLQDCPLNGIVSQAFIKFLRTRLNEHHLRELCYEGTDPAMLVDSLAITNFNGRFRPLSVASGLQCLTLNFCETHDSHEFIRLFSAQAHRIRLKKLHLKGLDHHGLYCLIECLPKLVYLEELKVLYDPFVRSAYNNLTTRVTYFQEKYNRACKANGSLIVVFMSCLPPCDASTRWISSFGERNRLMTLLLSNSSTNDNETVPGSGANMASGICPADIALFPHLFASAMQSPRMAPNWMLMGLVTGAECVGPTMSGNKRSAYPPAKGNSLHC
jgi:hypothetical protein